MSAESAQRLSESRGQTVESYTYETIPPEGYIRILQLLPGKTDEPIQCQLNPIGIQEAEDTYDALSYVWGDRDKITDIICNGKLLSITVNLFNALKNIRDPIKPKVLWVDAICINQKDDIEKSHQVKRMGTVYENARLVSVWLGQDSERIAKDCFELIRDTNQYLDEQLIHHACLSDVPTLKEPCPISQDKLRWDKVRKLKELPWFRRLWVVQEAGLAKKCILHWGEQYIEIAEVVELALYNAYRRDLDHHASGLGLGHISDNYESIQCRFTNPTTWRRSKPLLQEVCEDVAHMKLFTVEILDTARVLEASDKRDYIYSFLGSLLARKKDGQLLVEPNYTKTVEQVYLDVACALLDDPQEAPWVLPYVVHHSPSAVYGLDLPSWVPRWDTWDALPIGLPWSWFCAGGPTALSTPRVLDEGRLAIRVFIFDRLDWTSQSLQDNNWSFDADEWDSSFRSAQKSAIDILWDELVAAGGGSSQRLLDSFILSIARGCAQFEGAEYVDLDSIRSRFQEYCQHVRKSVPPQTNSNGIQIMTNGGGGNPWTFLEYLQSLNKRKVAYTQSKRVGIVPNFTQSGDVCCIVRGISVPLILREGSGGHYNLVGAAYIHGVMAEELLKEPGRSSIHGTVILE